MMMDVAWVFFMGSVHVVHTPQACVLMVQVSDAAAARTIFIIESKATMSTRLVIRAFFLCNVDNLSFDL